LLLFGLRRIPTGKYGVWNKVMRGQVNADLLICGSSRALVHYDPEILGQALGRRAFNLGRDGTLPDLQLAFLRAYLRHNKKPELVIQNLDLTSLNRTTHIYQPAYYLPYLNDEDIWRALVSIQPSIWKKVRYIPLYGFNADDMQFTPITALGGLLRLGPPEDGHLGFQPKHVRWNQDFERFKLAYPEGDWSSVDPHGVEVLDELIRLCERDGIRILLVYSPEYYENYPLIRNRQAIMAQFHALAARHGVTFLDYSGTRITRDKRYFYNSQHLNAEGARLFSTDLAQWLKGHPSGELKTNYAAVRE
jgi:hypothetical protein